MIWDLFGLSSAQHIAMNQPWSLLSLASLLLSPETVLCSHPCRCPSVSLLSTTNSSLDLCGFSSRAFLYLILDPPFVLQHCQMPHRSVALLTHSSVSSFILVVTALCPCHKADRRSDYNKRMDEGNEKKCLQVTKMLLSPLIPRANSPNTAKSPRDRNGRGKCRVSDGES